MNLLDLVHATGNWTECRICFTVAWRGSGSLEDTGTMTFTTRRTLGPIDLFDYSNSHLSTWGNSDDRNEYVTLNKILNIYVYF